MDDAAQSSGPSPPKEAYEAPRLDELGTVDELTRVVAPSAQDDS